MSGILKIGGKLVLICAVAAVILGVVNAITGPVIVKRKAEDLEKALSSLANNQKVGEQSIVKDNPSVRSMYPVLNKSGKTEGFILDLRGIGYGGEMKILAFFSKKGEVASVLLLDNSETPGLGKKAEKQEYMKKYIGKGGDGPVPSRKTQLPREEADAVTGATITFAGIGKALNEGSQFVKSQGGK